MTCRLRPFLVGPSTTPFLLLLLSATCRNRAAAAFRGLFSLFSVDRFLEMANQRQRKAPVTARTAGRSDQAGAFTTPGVLPAHFSALPTAGQNRPERPGDVVTLPFASAAGSIVSVFSAVDIEAVR